MRERAGGISFWDAHTSNRGGTFPVGQPTVIMQRIGGKEGKGGSSGSPGMMM